MSDFDVIGIELHSRSMWNHSQIKKALSFMADNGFNALIFHQSDIVNHLAYPKTHFSSQLMWEKFSAFRAFDQENYTDYLNNVIFEAQKKGISVYLNLKEIFYPDEIIELYPELVKMHGVACPTDPFWPQFIRDCIGEMCDNVPGIAGVILSCGTHESRTSMTKRIACECERCKGTDPEDWYESIFRAVYDPLKARQKQFIVRDFSFMAENQDTLLRGAKRLPEDVIISLKNTPHDFYPVFPDNPKIGTTGRTEWAEFDSWGQFFGSGIFPVSVVEDYKKRFKTCKEKGVKGVFFRVDWEGMFENSTFSSANRLNLYGAGLLANDISADPDRAYEAWAKEGWTETLKCDSDNPEPIPYAHPENWRVMKDFMKRSWEILRKTIYVRDHWFCEDNMFPDSLDKAYKMMVHIHGRDDYEPGASKRVMATDENLPAVYEEKAAALAELSALEAILAEDKMGFSAETKADMAEMLKLYRAYILLGTYSCHAVFETRRYEDCKKEGMPRETERALGLQAVQELEQYAKEMRAMLESRQVFYPHIIFWLLNDRRALELAADCRAYLEDKKDYKINQYKRG